MNVSEIKEYILEEDERIEKILETLECHHIKKHSGYYSCGMPDGDNPSSTIIYTNEYIGVTAYTRNIKDKYGNSDIISLIGFINKEENFSQNLKWLCDILEIDYYGEVNDDIPESIKWTKWILKESANNGEEEEKEYLKPIDEKILDYYIKLPHKILTDDGIPLEVQIFFEICYDLATHRIIFPIRDEIGTLVGAKGRAIHSWQGDKYIYVEPCAKSHVLYGLYQNFKDIKRLDQVIVVESEKSVMKLYSYGIFNAVAIGGHQLSKTQCEKLTRLGVSEIVLCYDEEVHRDTETQKIDKRAYKDEINKFIPQQNVSIMVDEDVKNKILNSKESPADDFEKYKILYENRIKFKRT